MKFRYAMVCSSNQNRSMEAHSLLKKQGFDVSSYGTGAHVKLPGPSLREPNVYEFGTPYKHMFDDLRRKDPDLYLFRPFLGFFFLFGSWEKNRQPGKDKAFIFIYNQMDRLIYILFLFWKLYLFFLATERNFVLWLVFASSFFSLERIHILDHVKVRGRYQFVMTTVW